MRESVDEQGEVDRTRSQTYSDKSDTYETQGGVVDAMASVPTFGPPAEPGEVGVLGPYRIIKQLGKGGMGAVYAALDTRLDRKIALKVMLPSYAAIPSAKERFLREARAAAKVSHDNVVTVYEADERNGIPYIAMQYLEGYPLDEYLKKKGEIDLPQILRIARETAAGLEAAHKLGLIHRDIKPGNLWLEAPNGRVKLLDFGLARPVDNDTELTRSGAIVGTPAYMSPEQAQGERVDQRSDLFSLGVMLYRLGTGQLPFQGSTTMAVLMALGTKDPVPVRSLKPELPKGFARLVHDLLSKDPAGRPQSATEVIRRLRDLNRNPNSLPVVSMPQVSMIDSGPAPSYVPIPIGMASMANPFENIDITESATVEPKPRPEPKVTKPANRKPLLFSGVLTGLLLLVVGIVVLSRNADKPETKVDATDIGKLKDKGKTVAKVVPKPTVDPSPDRMAAEWVLSIGGTVRVNGDGTEYKTAAELPKGRFTLTGVYLLENQRVTEAGLANLKNCKGLTHLDLISVGLTDAGLANFKGIETLEYLNLAANAAVTNEGMANFKDCKRLGSLFIGSTGVTNDGLVYFKDCRGLRNLDLQRTKVTDDGLAHLKDCKGIISISLGGMAITDAGLENFKDCQGLIRLHIVESGITDNGLAHFKDCKALTAIYLINTKITDKGLAYFTDCKQLAALYLNNSKVTDAGLGYFKKCDALHLIELNNTDVTDAVLANLKELRSLTFLDLRKTKVTAMALEAFHEAKPGCKIIHDGGTIEPVDVDRKAAEWVLAQGGVVRVPGSDLDIRAAADLPKERFALSWINLDGTMVSDEGLLNLRHLRQLEWLHIGNTAITDRGLANLGAHPNLTILNLGRLKVTDAGLAALKQFPRLELLVLFGSPITDAALVHLKQLKNLKHLSAQQTTFTLKAATELQSVIPACGIEYAGGVIEAVDVDRKAAEWVLSIGGAVRANGGGEILAMAGLPKERFTLTAVRIGANKQATDAGLANLKHCKDLTYLDLISTDVTDDGLAHLQGCKSLRILQLGNTRITDKGLVHFKDCTELNHLYLGNTGITDDGLAHFKGCKELTHLHLFGTKVTDAGLTHFKDYQKLIQVDLTDTGVTDGGLNAFKRSQGLAQLVVPKTKVTMKGLADFHAAVPGCRIEHDGGVIEAEDVDRKAAEWVLSNGGVIRVNGGHIDMKAVAELPKERFTLTFVNLSGRRGSDATLEPLKDLRGLTHLSVAGSKVSNAGMIHLKNIRSLTWLILSTSGVSDAGIEHLKELNNLSVLDLQGLRLTDVGFEHLKFCKNLTRLNLRGTKVTAKGLADFHASMPGCRIEHDGGTIEAIDVDRKAAEWVLSIGGAVVIKTTSGDQRLTAGAALPEKFELVEVHLDRRPTVTDQGAVALKGCRSLKLIQFYASPLSDAGLAHLDGCESLIEVHLGQTKVTDKALSILAKNLNLAVLSLPETNIGDSGLAHFKGHKHLTYLNLNNTGTTESGLESFRNCSGLKELHLGGAKVSAAVIESINRFDKLTQLDLGGIQGTDKDYARLKVLKNLSVLFLYRTAITDEGLAQLKDLKGLTHLNVLKTKVTAQGLADFHAAVPGCRIEHDDGVIESKK